MQNEKLSIDPVKHLKDCAIHLAGYVCNAIEAMSGAAYRSQEATFEQSPITRREKIMVFTPFVGAIQCYLVISMPKQVAASLLHSTSSPTSRPDIAELSDECGDFCGTIVFAQRHAGLQPREQGFIASLFSRGSRGSFRQSSYAIAGAKIDIANPEKFREKAYMHEPEEIAEEEIMVVKIENDY
jgi:hypothetical protein